MPRAVPSQVASVIDELSWNADCTASAVKKDRGRLAVIAAR